MRRTPPLLAVLLSIVLVFVAWVTVRAEVFTYRDHRGVTHFSNVRESPRWTPLRVPRSIPAFSLRRQHAPYPFDRAITLQALQAGIDVALVRAIVKVESNFDPHARSGKGAIGLMQLLPGTAQRYGTVNLYEPVENIRTGVRHLKLLLKQFQNNLRLTLAAYNAGAGAVTRYGGIPPFPETIAYVGRVLKHYRTYRRSPEPAPGNGPSRQ